MISERASGRFAGGKSPTAIDLAIDQAALRRFTTATADSPPCR